MNYQEDINYLTKIRKRYDKELSNLSNTDDQYSEVRSNRDEVIKRLYQRMLKEQETNDDIA